MNNEILASATFQIISNALLQTSTENHRSFRIKNLLSDEIVTLVRLWDQARHSGELAEIRLVVADSLLNTIPKEYVADPNRSITWYRNNITSGLVYLENEDQSDAQGLQNFFTLRDSNYLDGSFDAFSGQHKTVSKLLVVSAWKIIAPTRECPLLLITMIEQLISFIHRKIQPVPVRKFIQFIEDVCNKWCIDNSPKDEKVASSIIGNSLWILDLFPDEYWRDEGSENRILRRLELNARYADLRSSSGDFDIQTLIEMVKGIEFRDQNNVPLPKAESLSWRELCVKYISSPDTQTLKSIPYWIFEQLFRKDTKGMLLGDKVRTEILTVDDTRVYELDSLDVIDGLNKRNQADAERLLTYVSEPPQTLLIDLLTNKTRKIIERLANPPSRTFVNPMIEIARQLELARGQTDKQEVIASIHLHLATDIDTAGPTLGLFSFLYGNMLLNAQEDSHGEESSCSIKIDTNLVDIKSPSSLKHYEEKSSDNDILPQELTWPELPVKLDIYNDSAQLLDSIDLIWKPVSINHLAMFWLLIATESSPIYTKLGGCQASDEMLRARTDWITAFTSLTSDLSTIPEAKPSFLPHEDDFVDKLISIRKNFQSEAGKNGLSLELINTYFDDWQMLLNTARNEFIHNGTKIEKIEALLSTDSILFGDDSRIILPTHPFKLRWIGKYMESAYHLLLSLLKGKAEFAVRDGEPYLDWLENRTPHEAPPIVLSGNCGLLYSRSEISWFEQYGKLETGVTTLEDDPLSISAICQKINTYLDAHPYKRDGLSLLLVLPPSDSFAAELIERLNRTGLKDNGRMIMTIAAPKHRWEYIARAVERSKGVENQPRGDGLFPKYDLAYFEYERGTVLSSVIQDQKFDLAIVTHILDGCMQQQQNTEPPLPIPGNFDPLMDQTTQMVTSDESGATSIILKPRNPDPSLESWGTLVVRSNRASPVSRSQPENTDFAELRLNFENSANVFNILHNCCHWVITLERHISRKQIESMEAGAPDILSIIDGVGTNGLYTLVVSSCSGRDFIKSRLVRKLNKLTKIEQSIGRKDLEKLAGAIYDETRKVAPHLALNAMGISRVTEEMLGLSIARSITDQIIPLPNGIGRSVWISLDEHCDWFGGISAKRADMCRITFRLREDGLIAIDLICLEGKFRQTYDSYGIGQVDVTRQFMHNILATDSEDDSRDKIDSKLWRERILSAVESCSEDAITEIGYDDSNISKTRWQDIRYAFREGDYILESESAIYSICIWENQEDIIDFEINDKVLIVKSKNKHILPLICRTQDLDDTLINKYNKIITRENNLAISETKQKITTLQVESKSQPKSILDSESSNTKQEITFTSTTKNKMDLAELHHIYDEILGCFSSFGISVSAALSTDTPIVEGPASILFKIRPGIGVDPKKLYEKAEALKLHLKLDQDQYVGFDIDKGYVTIDVPKSDKQRYFIDAADLWSRWTRPLNSLATPLGEDRTGNIVDIDFSSSNSPHLLIGGTTGSGKSEALNTILYGLVSHYNQQELKVLLVDPKGTELNSFELDPHLEGNIGWDDTDAINILKKSVDEMQERYKRFKNIGVRSLMEFNAKSEENDRLPWWVIVLDEYADLTSDSQSKKDIEQELKRLAQKARAAGIHVIIATQKPSADVISTNLRSNLPAQLALRVKSGIESRVIMDNVGAETLNGKGDAYFKSEGKLRRVQCARVDINKLPFGKI